MSDELDDEYDDFDDSILEEEDEDSYEEEEEESEDDLYDDDEGSEDDDLEDEYEETSSCFVCNQDAEDVPEEERWKFAVADEEGRFELWACKSCREKFHTLEDFDGFRTDWTRSRLYRCAATLQRLILLKAPDCLIANSAFLVAGVLFSDDSESLTGYAKQELNKLLGRVGK